MRNAKWITDKAYRELKGNACPRCKSENIEGGQFDVEGGKALQEVGCTDCGASWTDVYILVGYDRTF